MAEVTIRKRSCLAPDVIRIYPANRLHYTSDLLVVEEWQFTDHPRYSRAIAFHCLERHYSVQQMFGHKGQFLFWYYHVERGRQVAPGVYDFLDLALDVIHYPDGRVLTVDLDDLADAYERHLIGRDDLLLALRRADFICHEIESRRLPDRLWATPGEINLPGRGRQGS
ncbi:MAG: DUF402 domain-containing protein [Bacillota bacterium]